MKVFLMVIVMLAGNLLLAVNAENIEVKAIENNDLGKTGYRDQASSLNNQGTLLLEHFGVDPVLDNSSGSYLFSLSSLEPTNNTETVTWIEDDYRGGSVGSVPSGGEVYDVEALYMDNDNDYIYLAVITSFPHRNLVNGTTVVGHSDSDFNNIWVRPGDISLDLGIGEARTEKYGSSWHYNYALDITHEDRDETTTYGLYPSCDMRDLLVGSELYKTAYDEDATSNTINPVGTSDWHTSVRDHGAISAYWEHTNFDPYSESNVTVSPMTAVGDASDGIVTAYYELQFENNKLEHGEKTYVVEATIPRSLFGADNPEAGEEIGFRYTPGCRNDGNSNSAIIKLTTTIKGFCSLGDYVWHDFTMDGIQDIAEPGIPGITVNLYDDGTEPIRTTTTSSNGYYNFDNLLPGNYYVEFINGDWEITTCNVNDNNMDAIDSDADQSNGQTGVYSLVVDQHETSADCGLLGGDPLPVILDTFNAFFTNGKGELQWTTQSESNNAIWNIYRGISLNEGQAVKVNFESLAGAGTTSEPTAYYYYDENLTDVIDSQDLGNVTIYYWLESIDYDGTSELHGPVYLTVNKSDDSYSTPEIPDVYGLNQNYPNPFNPDTGISFNLSKDGKANLVIYDIKGKKVKTLFKERECKRNWTYTEHWNGRDNRGNTMSSGIYLAVLKSGKEVFTRKMILQK